MTLEEIQSPLADRQEHQARIGSSNHGDRSALGNATQTIPSIIVTDASPKDASVDPLRLSGHIAGPTSPDGLGIVQGTDTEPDACVHGSHNQENAPLQSDIDSYVPWFETYDYPNRSAGFRIHLFVVSCFGAVQYFVMVTLPGSLLLSDLSSWDAILLRLLWVPALMEGCITISVFTFLGGQKYLSVLGCLCCLGLIVLFSELFWLDPSAFPIVPPAWIFGSELVPFPKCATHVDASQQSLFLESAPLTQPVNSSGSLTERVVLYQQIYSQFKSNNTLCGQGFKGNSDLYGLGQRLGLYLQWTTALVTNNLLPEGRSNFRVLYLGYSLTVCITTFVLTFTADCIFAIEIDILYWAYLGGYLCVFATSPSSTRLGSKPQWAGLDWVTAINYTLHALMYSHTIYSWVYGYSCFARMPCGTFHFYLAPVLEPSVAYWRLRTYLSVFGLGALLPISLGISIVGLILTAEIQQSISNSTLFQIVGEYGYLARGFRLRTFTSSCLKQSRSSETIEVLKAFMVTLGGPYRWLRKQSLLPSGARPGIRLVTPLDIAQRKRYRVICLFSGLACYVLSITAIETTLRWNKVLNVDSLVSLGQFWSLAIGITTFVFTIYQLLKQDAIRRRDLLRRYKLTHDGESIELDTLSHSSFRDAIPYAFGRADAGYLTNDGVLPAPSYVGDGEEDEGTQGHSYIMSGAL